MVSLSSAFDYLAGLLVAASIFVGIFQVSSSFGSFSGMLQKIVVHPTSFGLGLFIFLIGYATWTPAIPKAFLGRLGWLTALYPFTKGYFMSFSLWALLFALIVTIAVTLLLMHVYTLDFWFEGFAISFASFLVSWYLWGWIAWKLMYIGGSMVGFSGSQVYEFWYASVSSTSSPLLQFFFLLTIPIGAVWLVKKGASLI